MTDPDLPRVATANDEAAEPPPDHRPPLNDVNGVSARGEPAVIVGEGDEAWMAQSGEWIQAERWMTYNMENMR